MLFLLSTLAAGVAAAADTVPHNVIVVVIDDLGVDQLARYGGVNGPPTPNIDRLADEGVLFRYAYANPYCSPTRATIQTGRYSFRTGIGEPVSMSNTALSLDELTLPEMLRLHPTHSYASALFGKWHLGNESVGGGCAPILAGYSTYEGSPGNFVQSLGYFFWSEVRAEQVAGTCRSSRNLKTSYATTETVDDALAWLQTASEPFLLNVAFNAPHDPLHMPPAWLHPTTPGVTVRCRLAPNGCFNAMVEALDLELGRLLDAVDPLEERTTIVLVGDNGSAPSVILPPYAPHQAKGSVFEGGIRVPLIVKSPFVREPNREVQALVNTVDIFATLAEVAGIDLSGASTGTLDSISLVPYLQDPNQTGLRDSAFAEVFLPNGPAPLWSQRALRNARFKLIETTGQPDLFFDLETDPYERAPIDLTAFEPLAQESYQDLKHHLRVLMGS